MVSNITMALRSPPRAFTSWVHGPTVPVRNTILSGISGGKPRDKGFSEGKENLPVLQFTPELWPEFFVVIHVIALQARVGLEGVGKMVFIH